MSFTWTQCPSTSISSPATAPSPLNGGGPIIRAHSGWSVPTPKYSVWLHWAPPLKCGVSRDFHRQVSVNAVLGKRLSTSVLSPAQSDPEASQNPRSNLGQCSPPWRELPPESVYVGRTKMFQFQFYDCQPTPARLQRAAQESICSTIRVVSSFVTIAPHSLHRKWMPAASTTPQHSGSISA